VDDRTLLADMIGRAGAVRVAETPVAALLESGPEALARLGLSAAARRRLLAGAELARRYQPSAEPDERPLRGPRDCLPHLAALRTATTEVLAVLAVDARHAPIGPALRVAEGALMHVTVHAREVFAPALECRAAAIVIAHNHPSGELEPSSEDLRFTRGISQAGALLGVHLLDHLVLARRGYFSFAEAGLLRLERLESTSAARGDGELSL
jgi:DNA repair protein RadC